MFLCPLTLLCQIDCGVEDICIIEFNAPFNKNNTCDWLNEVEEAKIICINILESPQLQKEYKITTVPTILILDGDIEVKRYLPNIMLETTATKEGVQEVVEEILFNKF